MRILFDPQKQKNANDGLIVGDGQADFTKTYDEYHLNIFGKPFTLIDVPGIEGKEEEIVKSIAMTRDARKSVIAEKQNPLTTEKFRHKPMKSGHEQLYMSIGTE